MLVFIRLWFGVVMAGVLLLGMAVPVLAQCAPENDGVAQVLEVSGEALIIETANGVRHSFEVELAETSDQQAIGMMYREHMADNRGMLFPFPRPKLATFWNCNVPITLDLIFVSRSGRIANILTAQPNDPAILPSKGYAAAVFEVRGGLAQELGIKAGDMVQHPAIGRKARRRSD